MTDIAMVRMLEERDAEIERLNDALTDYHRVKALGRADAADNERLRAEQDQKWTAHLLEREELKAEIERLQSCLYAQESVPALYAEIKRLRAALLDIIDQGETVCLWDAQQIARRALEPKLGE